jgi:hypothetical protein
MKIIIQYIVLYPRILRYVDKEHLSNCLPKQSAGYRHEVKVSCSPILYSDLDPNPTSSLHTQIIDYTYKGAQGVVRGDAASCCHQTQELV